MTGIRLGHDDCANLGASLEREWLDTNGLGGYASSTVLNCNTRKYHGLLIANLDIPQGRHVILSSLEESVLLGKEETFLSMHKYPFVYHPRGDRYIDEFRLDVHPGFTYRIGEIVVKKDLMLVHHENTLLVRYRIESAPSPVLLRIKPLLAYRDIHDLSHENMFIRPKTYRIKNGFFISPYAGMPSLYAQTNRTSRFFPSPQWYKNCEYTKEQERGYPYQEDLFAPGLFEVSLPQGSEIIFYFSLRESQTKISSTWEKEYQRRMDQTKVLDHHRDGTLIRRLYMPSNSFITSDGKGGHSIIAGYHWFYEWGRDTLISLPGLCFYTGRIKVGLEILRKIAEKRKQGLIPNCVSEDSKDMSYNSADASLWYFWCVQEFLKVTDDTEAVKKYLWPVLVDILRQYYNGKPPFIELLPDGLLNVGNAETQLTWMDAKVDDRPVTPRNGCPVEINALWYNALCFVNGLSKKFGTKIEFDVKDVMECIKKSFEKFWIEEKGYLADVWIPERNIKDESVRPNQIFAVSLPHNPLQRQQMVKVVNKVTNELLTPYGLRTLSPLDPRYRGIYQGSVKKRDMAYHQGTIWPWLLGHYGDALLKVSQDRKAAMKTLKGILTNIGDHLHNAGLGYVSEIFNGDPPHEPGGCIAQAWSVAEILRLSAEVENQ